MKKQATMVYLVKDNKMLFLVRKKENDTVHKQGYYLPIGGKVEPGESIEDCARREVLEESGIKVNTLDLKGVLHFRSFGSDKDDWVDFLFVSEDFEGEPVDGNEGTFEWVDIDKILDLPLYEGDKVYFPEVLQNNLVVMEFLYDGHKYISSKVIKRV